MESTIEFKDFLNGWLAPNGDLYACVNGTHRALAHDLLDKFHGIALSSYPEENLQRKGWYKIWTMSEDHEVGIEYYSYWAKYDSHKPTLEQIETFDAWKRVNPFMPVVFDNF